MVYVFQFSSHICSALCLLLISYYPELRYAEVHVCLFFPSMCIHLYYSSNHFVCFPTNNFELNLDSNLNVIHPVQICVNAIIMQNTILIILSAHYQPVISQLFFRLFRNIYVFCSCQQQNIPVSLDVNLKEHQLQ